MKGERNKKIKTEKKKKKNEERRHGRKEKMKKALLKLDRKKYEKHWKSIQESSRVFKGSGKVLNKWIHKSGRISEF